MATKRHKKAQKEQEMDGILRRGGAGPPSLYELWRGSLCRRQRLEPARGGWVARGTTPLHEDDCDPGGAFVGFVPGEESSGELTVREKLHARLLESLPPLRVAKPPEESVKVAAPAIFVQPRLAPQGRPRSEPETKVGDGAALVVMAPFIVSDEARNRNLAEAIDRQAPVPFSIVRGGTAYRKDFGRVRMELGGWWSGNGIGFLRFSW